jgi:hypothetical protein
VVTLRVGGRRLSSVRWHGLKPTATGAEHQIPVACVASSIRLHHAVVPGSVPHHHRPERRAFRNGQ